MSLDNMLRVVVGTAPGPRSGLWRIFTSGDDIYVQHDGMRKDLKTSLHASGVGHHAWTDGGAERWVPDGDRYLMKWGEPQEFAPGGRALLGIVLPTDHLTVPEREPELEQREKITLFDPAPPGEATMLTVVLTANDTQLTAPEKQPSALLAHWPLPRRGRVWIVGTHAPWEGFQNAVHDALPQMRDQLEAGIGDAIQPGERKEGRAVLWTGLDDAGVPRMVEVGIEWGRPPGGPRAGLVVPGRAAPRPPG
jgi:hypothetical protein